MNYHEFRPGGHAANPSSSNGVELLRADSVIPAPIPWLWRDWLARGKLHILAGAPGTGKTTIGIALAAAVSAGGQLPDGSSCPQGNVVIWSGEDDPADTLIPRLIAAGADTSRCHFVGAVNDRQKKRAFDPAKDFAMLRQAVRNIGGIALLIVDPVVSAIASDSHKNADVRRGLQPLVDLAAAENCALLGITHFSKATGGRDPVERITGSIAFGAVARIVFVAGKEQADEEQGLPERRYFLRAKSNIGPDGGGFEYGLEQYELDRFPDVRASVVRFGGVVDGHARDILSRAEDSPSDDYNALQEAVDFLIDLLAGGPVPSKRCQSEARDAGVAKRTLERAKKKLNVKSRKSTLAGGWEWWLPEGTA